jgi:creatinine amidohydrolase/Fe(II)-dependent formamide hydrolase-like protein
MRWELLTTTELAALSRELPVVMNIAAVEQHGPHLPLATDSLVGEHFASRRWVAQLITWILQGACRYDTRRC